MSTTPFDTDVIVAGGGPAGLAAAIRCARAGLETIVVEPRPGVIDKACGEGLMPAALVELEALGIDGLRGHRLEGITYRDARDRDLVAHGSFPGGEGLGVRRTELHRALREAAVDAGVGWREEGVRDIEAGERWVEAAGLRGRWLIGADGLHSRVRRAVDIPTAPRRRRRFGVRRHYLVAPWSDRVEVHWSPGVEAYVTPVDDDLVGVALLYRPPGRFDDLLEGFPILRERLEGAEPASASRGAGPFEQRVPLRQKGPVLLVGDAAGYLDPLTGEGVALGLKTARAAAEAILAEQPWRYRWTYHLETWRYFLFTALLLDLTRPGWTHRPFIAMLARSPRLFGRGLGLLGE